MFTLTTQPFCCLTNLNEFSITNLAIYISIPISINLAFIGYLRIKFQTNFLLLITPENLVLAFMKLDAKCRKARNYFKLTCVLNSKLNTPLNWRRSTYDHQVSNGLTKQLVNFFTSRDTCKLSLVEAWNDLTTHLFFSSIYSPASQPTFSAGNRQYLRFNWPGKVSSIVSHSYFKYLVNVWVFSVKVP